MTLKPVERRRHLGQEFFGQQPAAGGAHANIAQSNGTEIAISPGFFPSASPAPYLPAESMTGFG